MTKQRLSLALAILAAAALAPAAHAQSALARIQYEEAEAAFAQNDLATTIRKLAEAERALGSPNPPILRLRIVARDMLVKGNAIYDFAVLDALRRDCASYNGAFANDDRWIDYTREVLPVCRSLSTYPATAEARAQQIRAERDRVAQAQAAERLRQEQERHRAAQEREAQRQAVLAEIKFNEDWAAGSRKWGWPMVLGGAGAAYWGFTVLKKDSDTRDFRTGESEVSETMSTIAVGGLTLGVIGGGIGIMMIREAGQHAQKARELRERNRALLGVAPIAEPENGRVGLALTLRF
jgi:hypothetical protein